MSVPRPPVKTSQRSLWPIFPSLLIAGLDRAAEHKREGGEVKARKGSEPRCRNHLRNMLKIALLEDDCRIAQVPNFKHRIRERKKKCILPVFDEDCVDLGYEEFLKKSQPEEKSNEYKRIIEMQKIWDHTFYNKDRDSLKMKPRKTIDRPHRKKMRVTGGGGEKGIFIPLDISGLNDIAIQSIEAQVESFNQSDTRCTTTPILST